MAETIKGGAYKGADGSWHDANGKPLPTHVIQLLEEQERQREAEQAKAETVAPLPPAAVHFVTSSTPPPAAADEDAFLAEGLEPEPVAKPKSKRKPKGGK